MPQSGQVFNYLNAAWLERCSRKQGYTRVLQGLKGVYTGFQGYKGIQGYTGVFKGLQGYARVYKGLQGYTGVYKGVQGYTRVYRGLQGCTRDTIFNNYPAKSRGISPDT